jgi:hypothetical protein
MSVYERTICYPASDEEGRGMLNFVVHDKGLLL